MAITFKKLSGGGSVKLYNHSIYIEASNTSYVWYIYANILTMNNEEFTYDSFIEYLSRSGRRCVSGEEYVKSGKTYTPILYIQGASGVLMVRMSAQTSTQIYQSSIDTFTDSVKEI